MKWCGLWIQQDWCFYKKGKFGDRHTHTKNTIWRSEFSCHKPRNNQRPGETWNTSLPTTCRYHTPVLRCGHPRKLTHTYVYMVYENQLCGLFTHPLKIHRGRDICMVCVGLSTVQAKVIGQEAIDVHWQWLCALFSPFVKANPSVIYEVTTRALSISLGKAKRTQIFGSVLNHRKKYTFPLTS